ncbi:MAG TPA: FtsX-like permease family protein, partial [Gemmatimonadaceae bacterium]|nr:FtsX-like permease family protein [Gemmatimonadaceae bacterium]
GQLPADLPRLAEVRLDAVALGVAAALTLVLGLAIGLVPVLRSERGAVFGSLRGGDRVGGGHRLARAGLVSVEVALAIVLLAGAGLLARTLAELLGTDPGFDPRALLVLEVQATGLAYEDAAAVYANHDRLRELVAAIPGVASVALANQLPLAGGFDRYGVRARDKPLDNPALVPSADRYVVTPDFMRTMRIALLAGRGFTPADADSSAPRVAIVSAALAARIWPGEPAVGKYVQVGAPDSPWREVVGVAADVRHSGLDSEFTNQLYVPERQWPWADAIATLVVRAHGDAAALAPSVREAVRSVDPGQPITRLTTMDQVVAASTAQRRLALVLFAAFSLTALVMAAAGIYGVLAGSVAERTREIGVRSALGASPRSIVRLVLAHGAVLVAIGLALGLAGAVAVGRLLDSLLFGVASIDPAVLTAVTALVWVIALLACLIPVRRALLVDPATALRVE